MGRRFRAAGSVCHGSLLSCFPSNWQTPLCALSAAVPCLFAPRPAGRPTWVSEALAGDPRAGRCQEARQGGSRGHGGQPQDAGEGVHGQAVEAREGEPHGVPGAHPVPRGGPEDHRRPARQEHHAPLPRRRQGLRRLLHSRAAVERQGAQQVQRHGRRDLPGAAGQAGAGERRCAHQAARVGAPRAPCGPRVRVGRRAPRPPASRARGDRAAGRGSRTPQGAVQPDFREQELCAGAADVCGGAAQHGGQGGQRLAGAVQGPLDPLAVSHAHHHAVGPHRRLPGEPPAGSCERPEDPAEARGQRGEA
mmetsp:Transcript_36661/g.87073  ORF Transcript_36661/g.87073 Transcript_36661/m.87073 type:complete len:306 (-) Transcript_36661:546-1463(-)